MTPLRTVCLVAALALSGALAVTADARAAASTAPPAAQTLSGCLDEGTKLSVLFLVDESSSLNGSDPGARRVDGIRAALTGLNRLGKRSDGREREVEVLFASFYGAVRESGGWEQVNSANLDGLFASAAEYRNRHTGQDTDYATALARARNILSHRAEERATDGAPPVCTALIWFTDGKYELSDRTSATNQLPVVLPYAPGVRLDRKGGGDRAVAFGRRYLCKPGGLLDRMVRDGIVTFTVGLGLKPEDSRFLAGLTNGGAGGDACGSLLSERSGFYLPAQDAGQLLFALGGLVDGFTGRPTREETCIPADCRKAMKRFNTVVGLSSLVLQADTDKPGIGIRIWSPDGTTRLLTPAGPQVQRIAGTNLTQRWVSDRAVEVQGDFDRNSRDWIGKWSYAFVDPQGKNKEARPYARLQFLTDAFPRLTGSPKLIRGGTTKLGIELAGVDRGSRELLEAASVTGTITNPSDPRTEFELRVKGPDGGGRYSGSVALPVDTKAQFMNVDLVASFPRASGGLVVPSRRRFRVATALPEGQGFPVVTPLELRLHKVEGDGTTSGELTVRGSSIAAGCARVGKATLTGPDAAGVIRAETTPAPGDPGGCLRVGRNETRTIQLRFAPSHSARGLVRGTLPVHLRSDRFKGQPTVEIPVSFEMGPKRNVGTRIAVAAAFAIGGLAFPLLLLHLLNLYAARFPEPRRLRVLGQDVRLIPGRGMEPREGAGALRSDYEDDFKQLAGDRRPRELDVEGVKLEAVASGSRRDRVLSLFRGPYAVATADDLPIAGGSSRPLRSWREGRSQEVPLGLAGTWIFYPTPAAVSTARDGGEEPATGSLDDLDSLLASPGESPTPEADSDPQAASGPHPVDGRLVMIIPEGTSDIDQGEHLLQVASDQLGVNDRMHQPPPPTPVTEPGPLEPQSEASGVLARLFRRRDRDEGAQGAPAETYSDLDEDDIFGTDPLLGARSPGPGGSDPSERGDPS